MTLDRKFYPIAEASKISGLSQKMLRAGCKEGRFPHVRVGRVLRIDLEGTFSVIEREGKGECDGI